MDPREQAIEDLMMALMLLTSWTEQPGELRRFWKGYDFDTLNALADQGMILDSRRAKSAYLTDEGVERARRVLAKYGIPADD